MKSAHTLILPIFLALALLAGCADDYDFQGLTVGEGVSEVTMDVSFRDMDTAGDARGIPGNSIDNLENLWIFAFDMDGKLQNKEYFSSLTVQDVTSDYDDAFNPDHDPIKRSTLKTKLPYGKYHIYAVANVGPSFFTNGGGASDPKIETAIQTEENFKKIKFAWNSASVAQNKQMSGAFALGGPTTAINEGDANTILINEETTTIHAWLRRAASKVTIAYDATQLNENIKIYIISARLKDVPKSCTLMPKNTPTSTDELYADGDSIVYIDPDHLNSPDRYQYSRTILAAGTPYGGLALSEDGDFYTQRDANGKIVYTPHTRSEESLFFYENMQGTQEHKHEYMNFESKDNVKCGTYVEVYAYYENKSHATPSQGYIIYRYMLGMNDVDDFNAKRNTHFKLTLKFRNDANNPDWHIVYDEPKPPSVEIPTPLYISYLTEQEMDIPLTLYREDNSLTIKNIQVDIVKNPYVSDEVFASKPFFATFYANNSLNSQDKQNTVGFLSLEHVAKTTVNGDEGYMGSKQFNKDGSGTYTWNSNTYNKEKYNIVTEDQEHAEYTVPIYTRPINIFVKNSGGTYVDGGLSGNNQFIGQQRIGEIKVTVKLSNGDEVIHEGIKVIQVKRIINPKAVWRDGTSTKPFTFTLKETNTLATNVESEGDISYYSVRSDGPWDARVYYINHNGTEKYCGGDWIKLKGPNGQWSGPDANGDPERGNTAHVYGSTNSIIEFDFRPLTTYDYEENRCGVIEVRYHDYKCTHLIFVMQGKGKGTVTIGGNKWCTGNMLYNGVSVNSPVDEGSMFKYGWSNIAYKSVNSTKELLGPFQSIIYKSGSKYLERPLEAIDGNGNKISKNFCAAPIDYAGFKNETAANGNGSMNDGTYRVAAYDDYDVFTTHHEQYNTLYGILYGENSRVTLDTGADNYLYDMHNSANNVLDSGMRGLFMFSRYDGQFVFFPIGNRSIGCRKLFEAESTAATADARFGVLKYATRYAPMADNLASYQPLLWDIYGKPGANYWYNEVKVNTTNSSVKYWGYDINFFSFLANSNFDTKIVWDKVENTGGWGGINVNLIKKVGIPFDTANNRGGTNGNSNGCYIRRIKGS